MGRRIGGWLTVVGALLSLAGPAWASDPGLQAEIAALKERLVALESKLAQQEAVAAGAEPGKAILQLPSGLNGVNLSGFVDTSYTYNFNEPVTRTSTLRSYDTRAQDFMLNNVELAVEKAASSESPVGFRTDLHFGTDAEVNGAVTTGLGTGDDELDIQQGYVQYLAPIGNGLDIKAGKFTTLHGAEVVESKDNWNFTHSYLFGFAEPLTHTGIRTTYPWTDSFSTMFGVSNGWDVVDDNNKAKTVEMGVTLTPIEKLSLSSAYMFGAEQGSDNHDQRHFWSLVAGYQLLDNLALKLAFDYGFEEDAVDEVGGGNATWNGVAVYAKYDVTPKWSLSTRAEVFNDQDGVRTAANTGGLTGSGIEDLRLFEWTLTSECRIHEHLIARLEYRLDKADSDVFRHAHNFEDFQNTIALELIAPF